MSPVTHHGSPVTVAAGEGHTLPLRPEDLQVSGLEAEWHTLEGAGLSEDIIGTALTCTRLAIQQVYDGQWLAFVSWCDELGFNPISMQGFGTADAVLQGTLFGYVIHWHGVTPEH